MDARKIHTLLAIQVNKTDRNDARGISNALRSGMFTKVHEKPQEAIDRGAVLAMRRCIINQRTDIKNHIRGILKAYGIRLEAVGPTNYNILHDHLPTFPKAMNTVLMHFKPMS